MRTTINKHRYNQYHSRSYSNSTLSQKTQISNLITPSLILNRSIMERNAQRISEKAEAHNLQLRPHLKTSKSAPVMETAFGGSGRSGPLCVSTLREIEWMANQPFLHHEHHEYEQDHHQRPIQHNPTWQDFTYAVPITPDKLRHVASFLRRGIGVRVITDSLDMASRIGEIGHRENVVVPTMIELDCGQHRTGIEPDHPDTVAIAETLHRHPNTDFRGVLTHGGHSYHVQGAAAIQDIAEEERQKAVFAADAIAQRGIDCRDVSIGSTPTVVQGTCFDGVTEIRPGVYLFMDLWMAGLHVCTQDDIALSVLTSVVSSDHGQVVVDAGALALSQDRNTAGWDFDAGYGRVLDLDGSDTGLIVKAVNQEHGILGYADGETSKRIQDEEKDDGSTIDNTQRLSKDLRFPVGTKLRILPNHACMTAAMYDRYHVVGSTGDEEVQDIWMRTNHWI
eukprot:gb/GECH01003649.1/.p1 GENE.gb/GECH01003649.1/~~gb/GECH01003649.1/.p1  ORF type:complete len:450 (+),score=87.25 gb/GECH01003649.1/:1-1350(+)